MYKQGLKWFLGLCAVPAFIMSGMVNVACVPFQAHTQEFEAGANDLEGKQLYFIITPSLDFYQRSVVDITGLGNDPAGDTVVDVSGGPVAVPLGVNSISYYGEFYDTIYIGADGTIGMGQPGSNADLITHFMRPQVSLLPVDTNGAAPGTVSYDVTLLDSVAVTYDGVLAGGATASAQAEFFVRPAEYGDIALTYAEISSDAAGVIGLSRGYSQEEIDLLMASFGNQTPLTTETMTGTLPSDS